MLVATLSALLANIVTGTASPAPPSTALRTGFTQPRETLQCVVVLRTAAETVRGSQGDSADARALTLSASVAEERYRRQAEADGLNPLQVEIALAAERDAHPSGGPEQIRSCLGLKPVGLAASGR